MKESTALGAAMCAGVGVGIWRDHEEAAASVAAIERTLEPDPAAHAAYRRLAAQWLEVYRASMALSSRAGFARCGGPPAPDRDAGHRGRRRPYAASPVLARLCRRPCPSAHLSADASQGGACFTEPACPGRPARTGGGTRRRCPTTHPTLWSGQNVGVVTGVWLITGAQGSGKSTVAEGLCAAFRPRRPRPGRPVLPVGGERLGPLRQSDREEARRLLDLRYRLSAHAAHDYAAAGFTCVVQDNIYGPDVVAWLKNVHWSPARLVVLRPSVEVVSERDSRRQRSSGKVAYDNGYTPESNDHDLSTTPANLGLWIDSSRQTPEETVAEILRRQQEALVG